MPQIVIYDPNATPQRVLQVTGPSADQGPYIRAGRTDFVVSPDLSALDGVAHRYWKHVDGAIFEYTTSEKDAQDAAEAGAVRGLAKVQFDGFDVSPLVLRAFADVVKGEINTLRALHSLPPRSLAQLRTAIAARIDSGDVDA